MAHTEDPTAKETTAPGSASSNSRPGSASDEVVKKSTDSVPADAPNEPSEDQQGQDGGEVQKTTTTDSERKRRTPLDEQPMSRKAIVMFALCMAVFLGAIDMTIIGTALPTIAASFEVSASEYSWIGSAYLLTSAASTPAWGKISDIFGRKPIILIANVIFFIGSALCGAAVNIDMLLAGRAVQGIGCGGLMVMVNIAIGDLVSMRARSAYYGIVGATWALAGAIGPVVGGLLSEKSTWRWCFYLNLPCDGVAFVILFFFLDIETPKTPLLDGLKAIDWFGGLAVVGGVLMFLFGLESGGITHPWSSAYVICLLVFGVVTFGIFFLIEWKVAKYPMMPLRLFQNRSPLACFLAVLSHGHVFIAGSFFLPLYFQSVLGQDPIMSGVYLFPFILSLSISSGAVGIYIKKSGRFRPPIWGGFLFMALGFGLFIDFPSYANWPKLIIYQLIAGFGVGPNFQAPLLALQAHIKPKDIGTGTAAFAFLRQLASAVSLVIGGVIFQNRMAAQSSTIHAALQNQPNLPPPPKAIASQLGGAASSGQIPHAALADALTSFLTSGSAAASVDLVKSLPEPARSTIRDAYTQALSQMWIYYAVVAVAGTAAAFAIGSKELTRQHEVRRTGLDVQEKERREKLEKEQRKKEEKAAARRSLGAGEGERTEGDAEKALEK